MTIKLFTGLCCLGLIGFAKAQDPVQVSEEQVAIESKLIEAVGLTNKGDREAALAIYNGLLAQDPTNSAAAYSAARLHQKQGDLDTGVKLMQQAYRADANNNYIAEALAEILSEADRHLLAADVYATLFARYPRREEFLLHQTQSLAQGGKPDAGLKVLQTYLIKGGKLTPHIGQQRFTLAVSLNNPDLATRALEELIAAFPSAPDYYQELAQFYRRTGNESAARQIWQRMLDRFPSDERASLGLAGQSKLNSAEESFINQLMPLFADPSIQIDNKILQLIPVVQEVVDRGDTVLANRVLPLAVTLTEVHPDEAKAFAIYGDLLLSAKRPGDAAEAYAATLKLDPSVYAVWEQYLEALTEIGASKRLLDESENALTLFPNQARLYYFNGRALARTGDLQAAENTLLQGAVLALNDQVLRYDFREATARVQLRQGRFAEALKSIDQAIDIRPKHGPALAMRAEIMLRSGNVDAARQLLSQALAQSPQQPYVITVEALIQLHQAQVALASSTLESAKSFGTENLALYHEVLGDAAFLRGDEAFAKTSWLRASELGGGSHLLAQKLSKGVYVK